MSMMRHKLNILDKIWQRRTRLIVKTESIIARPHLDYKLETILLIAVISSCLLMSIRSPWLVTKNRLWWTRMILSNNCKWIVNLAIWAPSFRDLKKNLTEVQIEELATLVRWLTRIRWNCKTKSKSILMSTILVTLSLNKTMTSVRTWQTKSILRRLVICQPRLEAVQSISKIWALKQLKKPAKIQTLRSIFISTLTLTTVPTIEQWSSQTVITILSPSPLQVTQSAPKQELLLRFSRLKLHAYSLATRNPRQSWEWEMHRCRQMDPGSMWPKTVNLTVSYLITKIDPSKVSFQMPVMVSETVEHRQIWLVL